MTCRILAVLALALGGFGIWVLLHPDSAIVQPWRAAEQTVSEQYVFGPYPTEIDLDRLKQRGVTTIISLLNPDLPYEAVLLRDEIAHAKTRGIEVKNFPMGSVLGQSFGADYERNSRAAADAALQSSGIVYIHCYLGLHRAKNVQYYLSQNAKTSNFKGSLESGRDPDQMALERASAAYRHGDHAIALKELDSIRKPHYRAFLQRGWVHLRMGDMAAARKSFEQAIEGAPKEPDAHVGLGFTALRLGDTPLADRAFSAALAINSDDGDAVEGMGYVRHRQGRDAEARDFLERTLRKSPDNAEAADLLKRIGAKPATPATN